MTRRPTTSSAVADERLESAKRNWGPRLLAHGVDYNDLVRITGGIEDWCGWLEAWVKAGSEYAELAQAAERCGRQRTAGEAFVRAAVYFHFGKSLWLEDLQRYRETTERSVGMLQRGMRLLDPSFERLEIPFDDDKIVANLRKPAGVGRAPFVILVPGLDSVKEEFSNWENSFLSRGLATVSMDGPGQGEAGFVNRLRPDFEVPIAALLDALDQRSDLDTNRIGLTGLGMGGYYASRTAAFEPRVKAVGVVGGPYQFARMPELVRAKFMHASQIVNEEGAREYAARFTLEGLMEKIEQPYLVMHGQHDAVMPWQEAAQRSKMAPRGEFLLFPEGNTACHSANHKLRPHLADWIKEKLGS